jgi:integrase
MFGRLLGLITVQRTLTWLRDRTWHFGECKTARSRRSIPHSCATLLLLAGENLKEVSDRLRHFSVLMTLAVYSPVLPSMPKAATDKLAGMLVGKVSAK